MLSVNLTDKNTIANVQGMAGAVKVGLSNSVSGQEFAAFMQKAVEPGTTVGNIDTTQKASVVDAFMQNFANKNTPDYTKMEGMLQSHPVIKDAIEKVFEVSGPDAQLFKGSGGDLTATIRMLASDIQELGQTNALENFFKRQQNLVGFGGNNWFGSHNMGNAEFASYQNIINDLAQPATEQAWNSKVARFGFDPELTWRDPSTGRGIGVATDPGQIRAEKVGYFDATGELQRTSTVAALPVYENAELFGINLQGIDALAEKLADKQILIKPGDLYEGSDAGLDFEQIANGSIANGQSPVEWEKGQKEQLVWQNQQAASAGMSSPSTVVRAALEKIELTAAMIGRYQAKEQKADALVATEPVAVQQLEAPTKAAAVAPVADQQIASNNTRVSTLNGASGATMNAKALAVVPQLSLVDELALLDSMLSFTEAKSA